MGRWRKLHRALAIALTVACVVTGSGFTVLATETSGSVPTGVNEIIDGDDEKKVENGNSGDSTLGGNKTDLSGNVNGDAGAAGGENGNGNAGNIGDEGGNGSTGNTGDEGGNGSTGNTGGEDGNGSTGNTGGEDGNGSTGNTGGEGGSGSTGNTGGEGGSGSTGNTEGGNGNGEAAGNIKTSEEGNGTDISSTVEENNEAQKTEVIAQIVFEDAEGNTVAEAEIKAGLGEEEESYTFTESEVKAAAPEGYTVTEVDLTDATAAVGQAAAITAVVEKAIEEVTETKAVAKVIFQDEEGNILEGKEAEIEKELKDGEEYTFTEEDIREKVPVGYILIKVDLTEAVVKAGDRIEIVAIVAPNMLRSMSRAMRAANSDGTPDTEVSTTARSAGAKKSDDNFAERPETAQIFFASANEAYTFNAATYWDLYQAELGVPTGMHEISSASENYGLTLKSSTDGYLINTGSESGSDAAEYSPTGGLTGVTGSWGDFRYGNKLTFEEVALKQGENSIEIFVDPAADIRNLTIKVSDESSIVLGPNDNGDNVQSTTTSDDDDVGTSTASNMADGWIEVNGQAAYKCNNGRNCFGYLNQGSVTYHFAGVTAIPADGNYTLELEYTGENSIDSNSGIKAIVNGNGSSVSGNGALRIDYETAVTYVYDQYNTSGTSKTNFNYSDGTSTIVGWGGDFSFTEDGKTDRFLISLKAVKGPNLGTVLNHLTIKLVDTSGSVVQSISGKALAESDFSKDSQYGDFQETFAPGYVTYVSDSFAQTDQIQGIKLIFESDETMGDISGTVEVGFVGLLKTDKYNSDAGDYANFSDKSKWYTFSTFDYANATVEEYIETVNGQDIKPYLRDPHTLSEDYKYAGHNRQGNDSWHMWTMSTSDANIVSKDNATRNGTGTYNALEIKYRNDNIHVTTASLTLDTEKRSAPSGEWLVINIKGEDTDLGGSQNEGILDLKLKLNGTDTISVRDFYLEPDKLSGKITAEKVGEGYQTIYYPVSELLETNDKYSLNKVEFDFSDVTGAEASSEDTHRVYIKDIYLISPTLTIEKETSSPQVALGQNIGYTLTVKNPSSQAVTDFTVKDTLPNGLGYCVGTARIGTEVTEPAVDGQTLSWTINTIAANTELTIYFEAQANTVPTTGNTYYNYASVTVGDSKYNSKTVKTDIVEQSAEDLVYYAEVLRETTLTVNATGTSSGTNTYEVKNVALTESTGWSKSVAKTTTVEGFTFAKGWNKVTIDLVDKAGNCDANMSTVRLLDTTGNQIAIADPSATNCIAYSEWGEAGIDTYITQTWNKKESVIFLPNSDKNDGCKFDNGTNQIIGNVNQLPVIYMVYVPEEAFGGTVIEGKIEFAYAMDSTYKMDAADVKCESGSTYSGVLTLKEWGDSDAPNPTKGSVAYVNANTLKYTPGANAAEGDGKDTFTVPTEQGIDVDITVYNYQVKDHIYVLDYGLKVNLTDTTYGNGLLQDASLSHEGDNASSAFVGLNFAKQNTTASAEGHYNADSYGQEDKESRTLALKNGAVSYTGADATDLALTYEPTRFMDSVDTVYYGIQVRKNAGDGAIPDWSTSATATPVMEGEIKVMPASVVYYEDNFAAIDYGTNGVDKSDSNESGEQSNSTEGLYGYDIVYNDNALSGDDSLSGSTKLTYEGNGNPTMEITFTGTGFDLVGRTTTDSGILVFRVYRMENGVKVLEKYGMVDTYYVNGDLYQIPVLSVKDLEYATHTATIALTYGGEDSAKRNVFYVDGVRIYNPAQNVTDVTDNYLESELSPKFYDAYDILVGDGNISESITENGEIASVTANKSMAALIETKISDEGDLVTADNVPLYGYTNMENPGNDKTTAAYYSQSLTEYLQKGPNHEVYLDSGAGIAFVATSADWTNASVQVEAKLADITSYKLVESSWLQQVTSGTKIEVQSHTAMYYDIKASDSITANDGQQKLFMLASGDAVSISNIKCVGCELVEIVNWSDDFDERVYIPKIETELSEITSVKLSVNVKSVAKSRYLSLQDVKFADPMVENQLDHYEVYWFSSTFELTTFNSEDPEEYKEYKAETKDNGISIKAPSKAGNYVLGLYAVDDKGNVLTMLKTVAVKVK